jgi:hypothetical protein
MQARVLHLVNLCVHGQGRSSSTMCMTDPSHMWTNDKILRDDRSDSREATKYGGAERSFGQIPVTLGVTASSKDAHGSQQYPCSHRHS